MEYKDKIFINGEGGKVALQNATKAREDEEKSRNNCFKLQLSRAECNNGRERSNQLSANRAGKLDIWLSISVGLKETGGRFWWHGNPVLPVPWVMRSDSLQ